MTALNWFLVRYLGAFNNKGQPMKSRVCLCYYHIVLLLTLIWAHTLHRPWTEVCIVSQERWTVISTYYAYIGLLKVFFLKLTSKQCQC